MSVLTISPKQARSIIVKSIKARLTPMLHGSPAIGKSSVCHQVAEEFNLKVIDFRLSQCDPTDLLGFPSINDGRASYTPMDTFPIEGDDLPTSVDANGKNFTYNGWLLFLDELPTAPPAVQAAAYKLILDRMVGNHKLHKAVAIVAAGNLESDNALVQPMSTALQSRLKHLVMSLSVPDWLEWARTNQLDFRITSYIQFKQDKLYTFNPNHTDHTYASPRTWEFANRTLKVCNGLTDPDLLPMLAGDISEGVAAEFIEFCKIETELPKLADIISNPLTVRVPDEPSVKYLLSGSLGVHTNRENLTQIGKYINRLPAEFQVITLKEIMKRNGPSLMDHPTITAWIQSSAAKLF